MVFPILIRLKWLIVCIVKKQSFMAENENNEELQVNQKQIDSSQRMQVLSKHVSEAIRKADEEIDGEFTYMEVMFVMNQTVKTYGMQGLKQEWK